MPHAAFEGGVTHVVPLQQPSGQSVALQYGTQAWFAHSKPALHALQAAPWTPQSALVVPVWQMPYESQQPFGQLIASQPHAPPKHS
jgi:hypothetical protein